MTLSTLIIMFAVCGLILTAAIKLTSDRIENIFLSYLQNFCGSWFIFSGVVKAMDPLGTAYKMEQYFAQFETTFSETWLSFITPIFPFMTEHQIGVSIFMIILEIILGLALIIGFRPKLTAWIFFLLMLFFTFLTGFTHLTGYVPTDSNFFDFAAWGEFKETQMRVTDCGCFGDFLKLKPYTSFLKDCGLMIPAFIFILASGRFHKLWNPSIRGAIIGVSTLALFLYCQSNHSWDIPSVDFRPFAVNVDVRGEKLAQEEALANTKILNYIVTNKASGQTMTIPYAQYLKEFKKYPKEEWKLEQDVSEPAIPSNKISEFEAANLDGNDVTEDILGEAGYSFMIVAYKIKDHRSTETRVVQDTTWVLDTIPAKGNIESKIVKSIGGTQTREVKYDTFSFEDDYLNKWKNIVNPVMDEAIKTGVNVYAITAPSAAEKVESFAKASASNYPIHTADDILLKTIIRSNPGVVLMKDGKILEKWHYKKLPSFEEIKAEYIK